ncbi:PAAR domain-containing protein [Citrobacter amalonaticus]|uniref:PAAR domain-containing protein n=1 Tax=Citrobacter amalonaticus TaxID=35703 RepID=A0A2S4S0S9_CITAM|nr:PAAR domain-containing protein [Citrobacter amalonaticus]POT58475.1 PAAR domain-containing protein [Citrobacter amalonaticus]POT75999.1 PAAR domain-containing protein [Citrobacter amalonaticus]POU67002.1 PAAR domain-containing protein [Citrobacter amalonaticus]POV05234.1 PAAR domain-containing protein [Citrobacter amalonaticus]
MGMAYFLRIGDKTTCGGRIITGASNHTIHGQCTARNGDKYICGRDKNIYSIAGGQPNYYIQGVQAAGTAHSTGTCPCKCKFINSIYNVTYGYESESKNKVHSARPATNKMVSETPQHAPKPLTIAPEPSGPVDDEKPPREPVDAGFCVLPYEATPSSYESWFFNNPPDGTRELFHSLNPDMKKKPGSILIIADPEKQDAEQIKHIENARDKIDSALEPLTLEEARFLYQNRHIIDMVTSYGSDYGGILSDMSEKYFGEIENTLNKIQDAYRNQYVSRGTLISEQFFAERKILFKQLDGIFLKIFREHIGLAQYDDMKKALRLSSSSIVHKWNQTGVNDIDGYATYIEKSAKLAKLMKTFSKVGIGLSALNGTNSIYSACTIGRDCEKTTYTEIGKFAGGIAVPAAFNSVIVPVATATCAVVLGALSAPAGGVGGMACQIIVRAGAAFGLSKAGEEVGESTGEVIYDIKSDMQ